MARGFGGRLGPGLINAPSPLSLATGGVRPQGPLECSGGAGSRESSPLFPSPRQLGWAGSGRIPGSRWGSPGLSGVSVGLARLHGQQPQHGRVLAQLHAALRGQAHVLGQVIHGGCGEKGQ